MAMSGITGIFYHISFSRRSYLTVGARLADFPEAFEPLVAHSHVQLFESQPVSEELILKIHTPELIEGVGRDPLCSTAWHSAGGCVEAGERIMTGELRNAFVTIGAGGHHSGFDYFGGYCCFNDVALTITRLRDRGLARRFAIVDTDAHHGDGTRQIFNDDPDVLHICLCGTSWESADGTKVDVKIPWFSWRREDNNTPYLELVEQHVPHRVRAFQPDLLFWYYGFDTHHGDYGSIGLTGECFFAICDVMMRLAEEVSGGRLAVVLGGGSRTDIATATIPEIIRRLAGLTH
ncbi:MAG: histone deacetylase [bacterium]|nr:histone deacetylase [bacterium]